MTERSDQIETAVTKPAFARRAELIERDAWLDLFAAAPDPVRAALGLALHQIGGIGLLASRAVPITELNRAMAVGAVQASPPELDAAIAWLDEYAAPCWALQVAPPAPATVQNALDRHGLQSSGAGWAKFVQPLPASAATAGQPDSAGLTISAANEASAATFGQTVQRGFGLPATSAAWFAALPARPGWHCFLATAAAEPTGAAAIYIANGTAWSGMSATLPDYRGRGVQGRLIAARLRAATDQGAELVTSETGRPAHRDDVGFSSYRNQLRAGSTEAYVRPNFKRTG